MFESIAQDATRDDFEGLNVSAEDDEEREVDEIRPGGGKAAWANMILRAQNEQSTSSNFLHVSTISLSSSNHSF